MKVQIKAIIYLVVSCLIGIFFSIQFNNFLRIEINSKELPRENIPVLVKNQKSNTVIKNFSTIVLPTGGLQNDLYLTACNSLVSAIEERTGFKPKLVEKTQQTKPGRIISINSKGGDFTSQLESDEAFTLQFYSKNGFTNIKIISKSRLGTVYGIYHLADLFYSGVSEKELRRINGIISPALKYRFVDSGAVGIKPDTAAWDGTDYSHHSRAFRHVVLKNEPFIDEETFPRVEKEFKEYVHKMISYGYNGIIINGFLEFVNFEYIGDGFDIYKKGSIFRKRHHKFQKRFGQLFQYASELGMKVVLKTDMPTFSKPLEVYFQQQFAGFKVHKKQFWEVYQKGLEELFQNFHFLDGIMIRIGEAGAVYNLEGWDYYSQLAVTTDQAVKNMISCLLKAAETYDKRIFFRTWSVGVGEVGLMHTNPDIFERIFAYLDSPNLIISTKHLKGDFYSYFPINPTFSVGNQKRLIEFQARREFEAFCSFPNYVAPLYQTALQEIQKNNSNINGIWLWTQDGGPYRAGPMSLYPFHGFWHLIDANVYATGQLAWKPGLDLQKTTNTWIRKNFSDDPDIIFGISKMLFLSRKAVLKGLYIGEMAKKEVTALGLEPPPTFYIWDIVSAANSVLSFVYYICKDDLQDAIEEGFEAVKIVEQMQDLIAEIDTNKLKNPQIFEKLIESLRYEKNLFKTLAWYRKVFLSYYYWLDTGMHLDGEDWQNAYEMFEYNKRNHVIKYQNNLDFPAYNFYAVDIAMNFIEQNQNVVWLARGLLVIIVGFLFSGSNIILSKIYPTFSTVARKVILLALLKPWRLKEAKSYSNSDILFITLFPIFIFLLSLFISTSFQSTYFVLFMLLSFGIFVISITRYHSVSNKNAVPFVASIFSPFIAILGIYITTAAIRGPLYFWYHFWTSPEFRIILLSIYTMLNFWLFYAICVTAKNIFKISYFSAVGNILLSFGNVVLFTGGILHFIGLDRVLTTVNKELAVLPLSLSKVLGMSTQLNLSPNLMLYLVGFGVLIILIGVLLRIIGKYWQINMANNT